MGYELNNFIGEVDEEFMCSICKQVLNNPVQLKCEHIYCYECIKQWVSVDAHCPDDRSTIILEDVQPPGRYYLNLLNKLGIKCDHHLKGCETITKLENIKVHLSSCEFNPNAEIVCSKGCNFKIFRNEVETHDCITFLLRQTNDNEQVNAKLKYEATKLSTELQNHHENITRLNDDINRIRDEVEFFKNAEPGQNLPQISADFNLPQISADFNLVLDPSRKWKVCNNVKTSALQPHILEMDDHYHYAHVQSRFPLAPSKSSFKIQILNVANSFGWILIGLTCDGHPVDKMPGFDTESIGYTSHGELRDEGRTLVVGSQWRNGDIIEVGIEYPRTSDRDCAQVFFTRNELLITEKSLMYSDDEAFPTICMFGKGSKVKCLNN